MNTLLIPVPAAEQAVLVRLLAARLAAAADLERAIVSQIALLEERHRTLISATLAGEPGRERPPG